ncbi:hypothetical protein MKW92_020124 [Papaver armeniacum]|nr:hypothetical protein MKW92_020124 [Papaver armeniacum]
MRLEEKCVKECFDGCEGKLLEYEYSKNTSNIIPHIRHVPWITVDQVPLKNVGMKNLKTSICKAYKGVNSEACRAKVVFPVRQVEIAQPSLQ